MRNGRQIDKGFLYKLLNNRIYIGEAVHKGTAYPGEHRPSSAEDLWDKVHSDPEGEPAQASGRARARRRLHC